MFAVVDLCRCELVHGMVVSLELARLEKWNRVFNKTHCSQLSQIFVIIQTLFASLYILFQFDYPPLNLVPAHKDGTDCKLVVLQIVKLLEVVNTLLVSGTATFFEFVPLFNSFQDCIDLQNLILEPHLNVDERVSQRVGKIVKISLKFCILGVLE